jgi:ABC-2 type transport system permease protein
MRSLSTLTLANVRSFVRDRAALFWTILFPVIFIVLFGVIFSGGGTGYNLGIADQDGTATSAALEAVFAKGSFLKPTDSSKDDLLAGMQLGKVDAVLVIPKGFGAAFQAAGGPVGAPIKLPLYVDPSSASSAATITQAVMQTEASFEQTLSRRTPVATVEPTEEQSGQLSAAAFFVPSILAMALMQLGIFSAIPLVEQREKKILKRLSATPLPRWALVGSNIALRLLVAAAQTIIILAVGARLFDVRIVGSPPVIAGFIAVGAMAFTALGYVIASFAPTEESANFIVSAVQFPMMFLSGIFFPLQGLPDWLHTVASFLPLTYLGDALRQTMVGGVPFAPLTFDALVLGGWLTVCLVIAARYFRWT